MMRKNKLIKLMMAILFLMSSFQIPAFAGSYLPDDQPILSFSNKSAIKYKKVLKVGEVEIIEFAKAVSLAHYGASEASLNYLELDKLEPTNGGYRKFIIKAKKPGYGELTFRAGKDLIKLEVIVQNDYKALEEELNRLFGMKNGTEADKIKVTPASFIGDISSEGESDAYLYLSGKVESPKQAMLAVAFAANAVGDKGVKIYSNPGGQLRQKDLESESAQGNQQGGQAGGNNSGTGASFAEFYESTNSLIDTNNLHRDVVLSSKDERVISFISIKEPDRFAVKVRFLEMDARYLDEFSSSINVTGRGSDITGALGSQELASPSITATGAINQSPGASLFSAKGIASIAGNLAASQISSGNAISGSIKILDNARLNGNINDLLNEGVLKIVNEFSLVIHSGERVALGKGIRFPVPKSNNNQGGQQISVEYIPIGFKGELKITGLENGLIDAQLASRLSAADSGAAGQIQGLTIPIFREEYVNSGVLLKDSQEVILNTFLTETQTVARATSPLGRIIPFLGKSKRKNKAKNLLFITLQAQEVEQTSKQANRPEIDLPDVNLEAGKHIYRDYIKELRKRTRGDETDLKMLNEITDDSVSLNPDFRADPLDVKGIEILPGIDAGGGN